MRKTLLKSLRAYSGFPVNGSSSPGSKEEGACFKELQQSFQAQYSLTFPDKLAAKTVVVVPSLTLDPEILSKVQGHVYYEERLLCLLMLLRMPRTNIVYVTSVPVDSVIIDYYLHLLPGITGYHAGQRLTVLSCYDSSSTSLTEKVLQRPRLIERIRQHIPDRSTAHLVCFNITHYERTLAVQLGIPVYGCDPDLLWLGTKSGSRELFRKLGVDMPPGYENLKTKKDVVTALYKLKLEFPELKKAVIKMNDGFSGDGNAVFNYHNLVAASDLEKSISTSLKYNLSVVAEDLSQKTFFEKFELMGGIVEAYIEGDIKTSPSVQCRINPLGEVDIISTHDQLLGGHDNQVFIGAAFPANNEYAPAIAAIAGQVAIEMKNAGVLGRFGVDFISVKEGDRWKHYAIEINLRKGGTTHPYLMLQFLTDGHYDHSTGIFYTASGQQRFYFASDNVKSTSYKGLTPADLIEIASYHGLLYDGTKQEGVMFHMISALSQYGKMGMVCIGSSIEQARKLYAETIEVLDMETSVH